MTGPTRSDIFAEMLGQDLRNFSGAQFEPLPAGDAGVERTINLMRRLVDDAVKAPQVDRYAIEVLRATRVSPYDREAKAQAIYAHVDNPANVL